MFRSALDSLAATCSGCRINSLGLLLLGPRREVGAGARHRLGRAREVHRDHLLPAREVRLEYLREKQQ